METEKKQKKPLPQQFTPGTSGNPRGRPRGARNVAKVYAGAELSDTDRAAIMDTIINAARAGDMQAARILIPAAPRFKSTLRPFQFNIDMTNPVAAVDSIISATAAGQLPADVAKELSGIVADRLKVQELSEMRDQLAQLAEQMAKLLENRR